MQLKKFKDQNWLILKMIKPNVQTKFKRPKLELIKA